MALPEDADLTFLLSEDAREEVNKKISILGLFAGAEMIVYAREGAPMLIPSLSFFFSFTRGEGSFGAHVTVTDPNAVTFIDHDVGQVQKPPGAAAMNVMVRVSPFKPVVGTNRVVLRLSSGEGTREYARNFRVIRCDPPS